MEFIGLFIAGILFFALSVVVGCAYRSLAWLILGSHANHRKLLSAAGRLPVFFAAYIVVSAIVVSMLVRGEGDRIFFGDLSERLPNGYAITAMAKMPDYGCIHDASTSAVCVNGTVGSLAVEDPFVFGANSHGEFSNENGYFALDTRNGTTVNFVTAAELDRHAGHHVHLNETFSFRSSDRGRSRLRAIEKWIWFGPPLTFSVLYFIVIVKLRQRNAGQVRKVA
jgi:hypothetical protein